MPLTPIHSHSVLRRLVGCAARAALGVPLLLAPLPAVGEEVPEATLHLRGEATADQVALLETLQDEVGGEVAVRFRDDGTLRYLAALDIAPACRLEGGLDTESVRALATCFFAAWPELFPDALDEGFGVTWHVVAVNPQAKDGLASFRLRQATKNLLVQGGDSVFTVEDDHLVAFGGTLFPPDRVALDPDVVFGEPADFEAEVEAAVGVEVHWAERRFDPDRGELVSYLAELGAEDTIESLYALFESSREIEPVELGAAYPYKMRTSVEDYQGGWTPTGRTLSEVIAVERVAPGTACEVSLDAGSDNPATIGNPKTYLATGGSKSGSIARDTASPCTYAFLNYPTARIGRAANAHFWVTDLAKFIRHESAAYNYYRTFPAPENLRVVLQQTNSCRGGAPACVWPTVDLAGSITEWRMVLAENLGAHNNLRTMAHEMGHYVGYSYSHYDPFASNGLLDRATEEGFADHNTLRYAMYRLRPWLPRPYDADFNPPPPRPSPTHATDHWGSGPSHITQQRYHNGESAPWGHNDTFRHLTYRPWHHDSPCNENNPAADPYDCGAILGSVYWTLAWNEIRVGFGNVPAGSDILSPSNNFYPQPEHLANRAYTYAVAHLTEDAEIDEFFDRVSEAYNKFQRDGLITGQERHRVNLALTAACVGWSGHVCQTRHVTTWGVLPVMYTAKETLSTSVGSREFYRAQDFWLRGGATSHVFADGVRDTPPARYVRLDAPGEYLEKSIVVPASGYYRLHAAVFGNSGCCDSAFVEIDRNGINWFWGMRLTPGWRWEHAGPVVSLTAGWHTLQIKHRSDISLEAVFIERVP